MEMFVWLAGPCLRAAVVEAETFEFDKATPDSKEIVQVKQVVLAFEITRHDQKMIVDYFKLVEQCDMSVGDVADEQFRIVWKKRVGLWCGTGCCIAL